MAEALLLKRLGSVTLRDLAGEFDALCELHPAWRSDGTRRLKPEH